MTLAIRTLGLTKRFGTVCAVDGLDLTVEAGEVFGLLGPNGAGKTTTIRLLLGLVRASSGSAEVFGKDVWRERADVHRRMASVPSETVLWPRLTGAQTLDLLGQVSGRSLDPTARSELVERLSFDPSKRGRDYSRGNRQKLSLIAAFSTRAEIFILDEPTTGLDPATAQELRSLVRERSTEGATILLSSHMLDEVDDLCDSVGVMQAGGFVAMESRGDLARRDDSVVTVEFQGAPVDVSEVDGVSSVVNHGSTTSFRLTGSLSPILGLLEHADVRQIHARRATLSEAVSEGLASKA